MRGKKYKRLLRVADKCNWTCCFCGQLVHEKNWSIEHIVPQALGGGNVDKNLLLAHQICNNKDGAIIGKMISRMRNGKHSPLFERQERYFYT